MLRAQTRRARLCGDQHQAGRRRHRLCRRDIEETVVIIPFVVGIVCLVTTFAALGYGAAVLGMVWSSWRASPKVWRQPEAPSRTDREDHPSPLVSVIMPAHNEERGIDACVRSILASKGVDLELIVVADRCSDRTVEILRAHRAGDARVQVVEKSSPPPPEWTGKCHAAWTGVQRARGLFLLFTDADTEFGADLIRNCLAIVHERRLDLFSLVGHLGQAHAFERITQPLVAMTLMRIYPLHRANRTEPAERRPFANGQFLMFRREAYEAAGGHEAVRHALLEDLRFAMRFNKRGRAIGVGLGGNQFVVRMYTTPDAFRRGWKRILTEGANRNIPRLKASAIRLRALAFGQPLIPLATLAGLLIALITSEAMLGWAVVVVGLLALLVNAIAFGWIYRMQGASLASLLRMPLGAWRAAALVAEAADDLKESRGISWADLHYEIGSKDEVRRPPARTREPLSGEAPARVTSARNDAPATAMSQPTAEQAGLHASDASREAATNGAST